MITVFDQRLNNYAGQIVWRSPMINISGRIIGYAYWKEQPNKDFEEMVSIGEETHTTNCHCYKCCDLSNINDRIIIDPQLESTADFSHNHSCQGEITAELISILQEFIKGQPNKPTTFLDEIVWENSPETISAAKELLALIEIELPGMV